MARGGTVGKEALLVRSEDDKVASLAKDPEPLSKDRYKVLVGEIFDEVGGVDVVEGAGAKGEVGAGAGEVGGEAGSDAGVGGGEVESDGSVGDGVTTVADVEATSDTIWSEEMTVLGSLGGLGWQGGGLVSHKRVSMVNGRFRER